MVTLVTYDDLFEHLQLGIPGGTGAVAGSANLANLTNHSTHLSNSTNHMAHAATIAGASGVSGLLPLPGTYGVPPMGQGLSVNQGGSMNHGLSGNNTPTMGAGGSATPVVPPVPSSASLIQLRQLLGQLRDTAVARRGRDGGGFSTAAVGGKAGGKGGGKGGEMGGKGKGGSMGDKGKGKAEDLLIQKAVKEEKKKLKKRKAEPEQKRPLAVGAHQVVGQGPGELSLSTSESTRNLLTALYFRRSKKTRPKPSNQALTLQFPITITAPPTPSSTTFHSPNRP